MFFIALGFVQLQCINIPDADRKEQDRIAASILFHQL
jgi:hypothetical protein